MRNIFLIMGFTVFVFAGCKSKAAFDFSEKIVEIESRLGQSITDIQPKVIQYMEEGNMDSLAIVGANMEIQVESSMTEIDSLPTPDIKEADRFKAASLRYFTHIKNIYGSYKLYALESDDSLRALERERMIRLESDMGSMIKEMQKAQQQFAKANGFRVESTK